MFSRYILFLLSLSCLTNCEMVVNIDLPKMPSKLVAVGFISPQDTLLRVYVSQSSPVFSNANQSSIINDATVQINNGTQTLTLAYKPDLINYYEAKPTFPIEAGRTYYLTVSTPDGRQVKGQCVIPSLNTSLEVSVEANNDPEFSPYTATLKWQDNANETNFYRTFEYMMSKYDFNETIYYNHSEHGDGLFKDTDRQGTTFSRRKDMWVSQGFPDGKSRYLFLLLNTDEHYYKYLQSRQTAGYNDENPFGEPTLVYSNIEGGLGVFAGYQQYRVEVTK